MRSQQISPAWGLGLAIALALTIFVSQPAQAQTYSVIHNFNFQADGYQPLAGLTIDGAGNLYGTTYEGGSGCRYGCGTVYKLAPKGSSWIFATLHNFQGGNDGAYPRSRVIFGPDGSIYGTTVYGGSSGGGTVFDLKPPARACLTALCPWTETVIYNFSLNEGWDANDIVFDPAGNIYGTTAQGGASNSGMIYELTPSNGSWMENTLYNFGQEGWTNTGVILDPDGNLYGTTELSDGVVYELTTPGWEFKVLHSFHGGDGIGPSYGLIFDSSGNLYGATVTGGANGGGTVYELTPSNGSWIVNMLYSLTGQGGSHFLGSASLTMDAAGSLYGTTYEDGAYGWGSVFKLSPSNGGWTYTSLHDFCAGGYPCSDGCFPWSTIVFDSKGNLYGTASGCGLHGDGEYGPGVVWEITP